MPSACQRRRHPFLEARKANGKAALVGLSAVGKCRRWKVRNMQPSTRGFFSDEPVMFADETSPPGETLNAMPTLPFSVGSWADAISKQAWNAPMRDITTREICAGVRP